MRFAPTDDQDAFRAAVRDVLAKQSDPSHVRWWWAGGPVDGLDASQVWQSLGGMGVLTALLDEDGGGMGLGLVDLIGVLEEAGRAALPEPLVETAVVALPLLAAVVDGDGTDGAQGGAAESVLLAAVEEGAAVAVALDDAPVLAAELAEAAVVRPGGAGPLLLVPKRALHLTAAPSVDGARHLSHVTWDDGAAVVLAHGPEADRLAADAADRGAIATAALLIGLADRMLAMTVEYVGQRRQFGVPIGSFQAVKHHLADAALRLEFAKPLVRFAAAVASGAPVDPEHPLAAEPTVAASMAKAAASDAAAAVGARALQCHGAIGYTVEHDLHLYLKRSWALAEAWGSAPWHRERIARRLLDT
jgi:alkylation response protein AidB-like acyl-CoA dehydrogenase